MKLSVKDELIKRIESAIEDERQAQIDYKNAAEMAEDPETRAFFEQLVKDEAGHEKILKRRLAALKLMK